MEQKKKKKKKYFFEKIQHFQSIIHHLFQNIYN